MSEQVDKKQICPYLGLADDSYSRFTHPDSAHRCFVVKQGSSIPLEHQSAFCMGQRYPTCPRFVELPSDTDPSSIPADTTFETTSTQSLGRVVLLGVGGLIIGLLIIAGLFYFSAGVSEPEISIKDDVDNQGVTGLIDTPTIELIPTEEVENSPTPPAVVVADAPTPTATVTPDPEIEIIELSAAANDIGWLVDGEERGNHFGDSFLYTGIFNGEIYNGAFLFDLSGIPRGAPIEYAAIEMTGLRDDRLAVRTDQSDAAGVWSLRMLDNDIDQNWRRLAFQDIFNMPVLQTLTPILSSQDIASGTVNRFELNSTQMDILEQRIIDREMPAIAFRTEGPLVGPDNLFAWDTGYGPESQGDGVTLILRVGLPPPTPPAYDYVLVTSTPTPENVMTAAAVALQLTADATQVGTATPLPPNAVTATPYPDYLVLVATATPENAATAGAVVEIATAMALTTGTPTPIPTNAVTATPTATETPTPTPTTPKYILITSTPTPDTIFAAATQAVLATAVAERVGTPTPLPINWVTPIVVTVTPTPLNGATVQAVLDLATAVALTTGTPTPIPPNMVTATPTPVFETIPLILPPTPEEPPTVVPDLMPAALLGKILFMSDRESEESIYVYDPATGELGRLTADWPYEMARERNAFSADTVFRAYVKELLWLTTNEVAIHYYDYKYGQEDLVTRMGTGIVYDPKWSPVSNEIAFVATETKNDEIWVINYDGTNPRQLTFNDWEWDKSPSWWFNDWEWDKSPSWSPDGQQIVFSSNRTGNQQLWIMNADGSDQRLLMGWDNWTPYNDWAPVWVKYLDPAPPEDKKR